MSTVDHTPRRLRALIYNRVSSDPSGRRVSVKSQDAENRAFCERHGWDIAATITDNDRSATRFARQEREGYTQVLAALDGSVFGRIDVLVTWESSRGERRLDGYVRLRDRLAQHAVLLAYKGRVFDLREGDDRFTTGLDALLDEREAERIRERTLRGHRTSVMKGAPRGIIPYGYRREYDPHAGHMIAQVPDPVTAPIVQEIGRRILGGDTLYEIAQDLNDRRVPTPRSYRSPTAESADGSPRWRTSQIRQLMRKQSLMGIRTYHGKAVGTATWEPIIEPADWAQIQAVLADPTRRKQRGVAPRHLLSGIPLCGVCGARLRPLSIRGRQTYSCAGATPTSSKGHVTRAAPALDDYVTEAVVSRLSQPDAIDALTVTPEPDRDVSRVMRELANVRTRLEEFQESARAGAISAGSFAKIEAGLLEDIAALEAQMTPAGVPTVVRDMAGPDAEEFWDNLELEDRRTVIRAVCTVTVHRRVSRSSEFEPSTVVIEWL